MINATPRPPYPWERPGTHCIGGSMGLIAGLDLCGKPPPPTGIRSPDRPASSESLYRLKYLEKLTFENMETEIRSEAASFCSYSWPSPTRVVTRITSEQQLSAFTYVRIIMCCSLALAGRCKVVPDHLRILARVVFSNLLNHTKTV
jgi:hypothetical protein